jgi:hypothetical protein
MGHSTHFLVLPGLIGLERVYLAAGRVRLAANVVEC